MDAEARKRWLFELAFGEVYPNSVAKAEKKGRTKLDVDKIIRWLTGYDQRQLMAHVKKGTDIETFITEAPELNEHRSLITGVICGVRVEEVEDDVMRELRYIDKLIDELARGKKMESILRTP